MLLRYLPIKLLLLALCSPVFAQSELWSLEKTTAAADEVSTSSTTATLQQRQMAQGQQLQPDLAQIDQLQVDDRILLPLPEGVVEAVVEKIQSHSAQSYSVTARIQHGAEKLPVVITRGHHGFFGRIVTPTTTYVIRGDIDNSRLLVEHQLTDQLDFSKSDALVPKLKVPKLKAPKLNPLQPELQQPAINQNEEFPPITDETMAVIDVLMVYSPQAAELYNGDVATRLHHLLAVTNQIYRDSGVFVEMRAAQMKEVPVVATGSYAQLDEITLKQHAFADLDHWRAESGADMVALFTPFTESLVCGLGWYATNRDTLGQISFQRDYMVSLTHISCSDYVLAHEAGHNMGLSHSERQGDAGWTFPFARGYGVVGAFATVMAYDLVFEAPQVYQFSNPELQCSGHPCGVERHSFHGADARYAINAVRQGLSQLYSQDAAVTFDKAVANITDPVLKSCLANIKIANPELKYTSQLNELGTDDFGNNCNNAQKIVSLAGLEQFTFLEKIYLSGHLISDFSTLGQLKKLTQITLSGTQNISLEWLDHLPALTSLTLYNFTLNDLTAVGQRQTLRELNFNNISVSSFAPLQTLNQLRQLTIVPSPASPDKLTTANWLSGLTSINRLFLPDTRLSQLDSMSGLTMLDTLQIGSTLSLNVMVLQGLTNMQSLDLSQNPLLDCGASYQLWRALTKLHTFKIPAHCKTNDVAPPVMPALPDIVVEATATLSDVQLTAPTAQDNADGAIVAVTADIGPFSVGTHEIQWQAADYNGNTALSSQTLTIRDTTAPILHGSQHQVLLTSSTEGLTRNSSGVRSFFMYYHAVDLVSNYVDIVHPDPEYWPLGVHEVLLQATDDAGNSAQRTVIMIVNYRYGPRVTMPPTLTLTSPGPAGLPATDARVQQFIAQVTAIDSSTQQPLAIQSEVPTQLLPGKNLLFFSATDSRGIKNTLIAEIILADLTAPTLQIPPTLKLTAGSSGIAKTDPRIVQFLQSVKATDDFDTSMQITNNAPDRFLPGITAVRFTSTDSSGNTAIADGFVEVELKKRKNKVLKMLLMVPRT